MLSPVRNLAIFDSFFRIDSFRFSTRFVELCRIYDIYAIWWIWYILIFQFLRSCDLSDFPLNSWIPSHSTDRWGCFYMIREDGTEESGSWMPKWPRTVDENHGKHGMFTRMNIGFNMVWWCPCMFIWCLYDVYMLFIWCLYDVYMMFIYVYMMFIWSNKNQSGWIWSWPHVVPSLERWE